MNRRDFLASIAALVATSALPGMGQSSETPHWFPPSVVHPDSYIEKEPIAGYHNASASA